MPRALRTAGMTLAAGSLCWLLLAVCGSRHVPSQSSPAVSAVETVSTDRTGPRDNEQRFEDARSTDNAALTEKLSQQVSALREELDRQEAAQQRLASALQTLQQQTAAQQTAIDRAVTQQELSAATQPLLAAVTTWTRLQQRLDHWEKLAADLDRGLNQQLAEARTAMSTRQSNFEDDIRSRLDHLTALTAEADAVDVVDPIAVPELLTKLYQPLMVRAANVAPLVQPLLTPGWGICLSAPLRGDDLDVLLIRDTPDVLTQVDRLLQELDRPAPGLELELSVQSFDRATGLAQSPATQLPSAQVLRDGASLLVPETFLRSTSAGSENASTDQQARTGDSVDPEFLPPLEPQPATSTLRVLRITPRLVVPAQRPEAGRPGNASAHSIEVVPGTARK